MAASDEERSCASTALALAQAQTDQATEISPNWLLRGRLRKSGCSTQFVQLAPTKRLLPGAPARLRNGGYSLARTARARLLRGSRRGGRVVEGARLLSGYTVKSRSWVRIPSSPPHPRCRRKAVIFRSIADNLGQARPQKPAPEAPELKVHGPRAFGVGVGVARHLEPAHCVLSGLLTLLPFTHGA